MMKEYIFDISKIESLDGWWDMYLKVVHGPESELFGRNRDAYSDSLDGGPGCPEIPCRFVFINMGKVTFNDLMKWTKNELEKKKLNCHSSAVPLVDMRIKLNSYGKGKTLHHWIIDPVLGHEGFEVVVKHGV